MDTAAMPSMVLWQEEGRVVVMRFGHDYDQTCMQMDEVGVDTVHQQDLLLLHKAARDVMCAR